jgi:hypothetical protein
MIWAKLRMNLILDESREAVTRMAKLEKGSKSQAKARKGR